MSLRRANEIGRKLASSIKKIYEKLGQDAPRQAYDQEIAAMLHELGFHYRTQETFFIPDKTSKSLRHRYIVLHYVIEDLVILQAYFQPSEDPLEARLMQTYMKLSKTKAAVRVNFGTEDPHDAVLFVVKESKNPEE